MLHLKDPMNAGDICTRTVAIAFREMTVDEAARVMREQHVGCLVVVEEIERNERVVVGMLTDRDIAMGVVAAELDGRNMRVSDLMSKDPVTAREEDSLLDLLSAMRRKRVRRIPVVSPEGTLIGIVAMDDVLEVLAQQMQAVATAIIAAGRHEGTALP